MRFHANHVSSSISGDYYQVMFEAEEDTNDPDSPYLLIQRQFETLDDGRCYIETPDEQDIGHFFCAVWSSRRRGCQLSSTGRATILSALPFAWRSRTSRSITGNKDHQRGGRPSLIRHLCIQSFSFSKIGVRASLSKCVGTRRRVQCMVQKRRNRNH